MKATDRIEFLGETRGVESTTSANNWIDVIARSTETVQRYKEKPLLAELGFAALIDLKHAGTWILWDPALHRAPRMGRLVPTSLGSWGCSGNGAVI